MGPGGGINPPQVRPPDPPPQPARPGPRPSPPPPTQYSFNCMGMVCDLSINMCIYVVPEPQATLYFHLAYSFIYLSVHPPPPCIIHISIHLSSESTSIQGLHNYHSPIIECFDLGFCSFLSSLLRRRSLTRSAPPMRDGGMRYGNKKNKVGRWRAEDTPPSHTHTPSLHSPSLSESTVSVTRGWGWCGEGGRGG